MKQTNHLSDLPEQDSQKYQHYVEEIAFLKEELLAAKELNAALKDQVVIFHAIADVKHALDELTKPLVG